MKVTIEGVDRSTDYTEQELEGIEIVLEAEDGSQGVGTAPIPTTDAPGEEAASGQQILLEVGAVTILDGFIGGVTRDRGEAVTGDRRTLRYTVVDENALLKGHRAVKWKRPEETDRARMLAAIHAFMGYLDLDTSMVLDTHNETIPGKTYTTEEIFDELQVDCGEPTAKLLFIESRRIHWHRQDEGDAAGLEIVATGADNSTTFELNSAEPPQRAKDGMDLITDVLARNPTTGLSYQASDATAKSVHDAAGVRHERLIEVEGATLAQLTTRANRMLATYKTERISYEGTIGPLTAAQVALIPPGSLITVTNPVWGLTDSVQRIASVRLKYVHRDKFMATLNLGWTKRVRVKPIKSTAGSSDGTGADTGGGVSAPCGGCPPYTGDLAYEEGEFRESFSWGGASSGDLWEGTSESGHEWNGSGQYTFPGDAMLWGAVTGAEVDTSNVAGFEHAEFRLEADAMFGLNDTVVIDSVPSDNPSVAGAYTRLQLDRSTGGVGDPDGLSLIAEVDADGTIKVGTISSFATGSAGIAPGVPFKIVFECSNDAGWMRLAVADGEVRKDFTPGSLSEYDRVLFVRGVGGGPDDDGAVVHYYGIRQYNLTGGLAAPSSGQLVENEATGTGDGSTTQFTTSIGYRPGSLRVKVNGIDVTDSMIGSNPYSGQFTLNFAPRLGSEITTSYMAR